MKTKSLLMMIILVLMVPLFSVSAAAANDYTQGVSLTGSNATIWIKPTVIMTWADVHYRVNNRAQENVRLAYNSSAARYEYVFSAAAGDVIQYSFTYFNGTSASDTPWFTGTVTSPNQVAEPVISPAGGSYASAQSVTITAPTAGSTIRYTTNGSDPTDASPVYSGPIEISQTTVLKAVATKSGMISSAIATVSFTIGAAAVDSQGVAVSGSTATVWYKPQSSMAWVDAHYNVNSGAQRNERMVYNSSLARYETNVGVNANDTIQYSFTHFNGSTAADTAWFSFSVTGGETVTKVSTPVISPASGTYSTAQAVTITSATAGAAIYYTTDGTTPTTSSTLYSGSISISATTQLKAIAVKTGMTASSVATADYIINTPAVDYTQGVDESGTTATIWFKSNVSSAWVDNHYKVNNGTVANASMTYNSSKARYEQNVTVATADVLSYSFTYNKATGGVDTAAFIYNVKGQVKPPVINPSSGSFTAPQQITITSDQPGAVIRYTTDGSTPTGSSPVYSIPFTVSSTLTVKAIATKSGMYDSSATTANFLFITNKVAMPVLHKPGGTFATEQTVTITSNTAGAVIRYTTDGSVPTASSPVYTGPITVSSTKTIQAIATKSGMDSSNLASGTYIIDPNAQGMIFQFQNDTNGIYANNEVYWMIYGRDPVTHKFVFVDMNGNLVPASESMNTISIGNRKAVNMFYTLAQKSWVKMPDIESGRMYISYGSPVYINVNTDINGDTGIAGPDLNNTSDPNYNVYFEFLEFTILNGGEYWGNTTRVDGFSFPVVTRMTGEGGYDKYPGDISVYDKTVGDIGTRAEIFAAYQQEVPTEFKSLIHAPYRIVAPGKGLFDVGKEYGTYFDDYIDEVWSYYRTHDLTFALGDFGTVTGRVQADGVFNFTNGSEIAKVYKPNTAEVLEGKGNFDKGTSLEKAIEAHLCAAINRHVATDVTKWTNAQSFYQTGPANYYADFWHRHGINGYAYGFCYDDVYEFSTLLHYTKPQALTITLGW